MSYEIRSHVKANETKVRLDDETDELLRSMARFSRTQKAVLARRILIKGLREMLEELGVESTAASDVA